MNLETTLPAETVLDSQAGEIIGGFVGGGVHGGLRGAVDPTEALAEAMWKRGYVRDNNGQTHVFASEAEAMAAAQEFVKQNPRGIIGSLIQKGAARNEAASLPEVDAGARAASRGTFSNRLSELRVAGLIVDPGKGLVAANKEALFLNGEAA